MLNTAARNDGESINAPSKINDRVQSIRKVITSLRMSDLLLLNIHIVDGAKYDNAVYPGK